MKTAFQRIALLAVTGCLSLSAVAADPAPAQFAMFDVKAPDVPEVKGVRLAFVYGESDTMTGVDFSLGLSVLDNMTGVSVPIWIGGNRVRGNFTGLGIGLLNWHEGSDTGVNVGGLNLTNDVNGLNVGLVNISSGDTVADVSMVNISKSASFQLAWFNNTDTLRGVQIGLLNCARNGFLPCFPIINFPAAK